MQLEPALEALRQRAPFVPDLAIVLGSGLGAMATCEEARRGTAVPFTDLPGFPAQTVAGHGGRLVFCELEGRKVLLQAGRFHFYEGHPMALVTAPMRLYGRLGVKTVVHTNAAGAINPSFAVGQLMVISDHVNFMGTNPLIGPNHEPGPRFPDMSRAYDPDLRKQLHAAAAAVGMTLQEGAYLAVTGPSYETPAEIRAFRAMGADAVGMSTVPEVIVAAHMGVKVTGISCITNLAAGLSKQKLSHAEVSETADRVKDVFSRLLTRFLSNLGKSL